MTTSTRSWPGANEVHIWRAVLDLNHHELSKLQTYLSTDERDRADRYRSAGIRVRYIAARGWLRYLLGTYVGGEPSDLVFVRDEHGKPRLARATWQSLSFNVSHSDGTALFAVAQGREVGIDVERVRGDVPLEVVRRYFSDAERDALAALPAGMHLRGFFECWTRKEAYLKATGVGLSGLVRSEVDAAAWSLHAVDAGPDYVAALAVAGSPDVPGAATWLAQNESPARPRELGSPLVTA
ncbi:MAG: 4'-phosphopantetheinyl transferase superfamily protein [Solirubrobacteraceae bacterium]